MKKITLQTIADRLGVSKALVSKALSNDPAVNEGTRETIWKTAEELGYRIKAAKKAGPSAATGHIAVLFPNAYLGDLEYWGEIIRGIHHESAQLGYNLMLTGIDISLPPLEGMPAIVKDKNVDGVIALGHVPVEYLTMLKIKALPLVMVDGNEIDPAVDHVRANNFWGAHDAVGRLLKQGHRRVAFVGDPTSALSFLERQRGFEQALHDYETERPDETVRKAWIAGMGVSGNGNYFSDDFPASVKRHLEGEEPITAMFCANDMIAIEVLNLMATWGIRCPASVSVCGFDDLLYAERANPKLSTMVVPRMELGKKAVQLVHRRIREPGAIAELVMLPTEYRERESIGAPAAVSPAAK
jgi:DNA-binding LacI/PurR family transcriptional regulator